MTDECISPHRYQRPRAATWYVSMPRPRCDARSPQKSLCPPAAFVAEPALTDHRCYAAAPR